MEKKKVKVDIQNGVYLDKNDMECETITLLNDPEAATHLAMHVYHSEYLGEL